MIHLTPIPKVRMKSVTIIGSGNWGSAIAKIVGNNTARYPDIFEKQVTAWIKLSVSISDDCFSSFHYYVFILSTFPEGTPFLNPIPRCKSCSWCSWRGALRRFNKKVCYFRVRLFSIKQTCVLNKFSYLGFSVVGYYQYGLLYGTWVADSEESGVSF